MNNFLEKNTIRSNTRLLYCTMIILIIANLSVVASIIAGSASEGVTFGLMGKEMGLAAIFIFVDWMFCKRYGEKTISQYISVTTVAIVMFLFDTLIPASKDIYTNMYLIMGLALLYFDVKVSVYAFFMVVTAHSLMLMFAPNSFPTGNVKGALTSRYVCFLLFGIASFIVAKVAAELLKKTIKQVNDLSELSGGVVVKADQLANSAEQLNYSANESGAAAEQVKDQIESLSRATTETASYTSNTTILVNKMSMTLTNVSSNMDLVTERSLEFKDIVGKGYDLVQEQVNYTKESKEAQVSVNEAINILSDKSKKIEGIIVIISQIANKTNLLALNAAIEAARAGDAGRSFAVVADEIRNLAVQSSEAARGITDLVRDMQDNTIATNNKIQLSDQINTLMETAVFKIQDMFTRINSGADSIYDSIHETSASVEEMLVSTDEVVIDINNISSTTEETAAGSEEIAALSERQAQNSRTIIKMSENLASASDELRQMVEQFKNS